MKAPPPVPLFLNSGRAPLIMLLASGISLERGINFRAAESGMLQTSELVWPKVNLKAFLRGEGIRGKYRNEAKRTRAAGRARSSARSIHGSPIFP